MSGVIAVLVLIWLVQITTAMKMRPH